MRKFIVFMFFILMGFTGQVFAETSTIKETPAQIKPKVEALFADAPIMISIARCESTFRQFTDSGNVFRGGTGAKHVGVFQINDAIHKNAALALGFDVYTVDGNLGYAKHLYQKEGTRPWSGCVPSTNTPSNPPVTPPVNSPGTTQSPPTSSNTFSITMNLRQGMTSDQVLILQKMLNEHGFKIADSGPGSPGKETRFYGSLTRQAVERFQCAKNIVCPNGGYISGYGYMGPKTRAALEAL